MTIKNCLIVIFIIIGLYIVLDFRDHNFKRATDACIAGSQKLEQPMTIEEAKKLGINADGPLPCDTSFITAYKNKNHDCIVGMYHDALQSGLKAFGFDRGVTVQGGLPVPITTPAHGTAFDIAGKNEANLEPTLNSFKIALTMAENKNKQ